MPPTKTYLVVQRNVGGAPIYDGCSHPEIIRRNGTNEPNFFKMGVIERELYKAAIAKATAQLGGVEAYKANVGCHLDCRPFTPGKTDMRMESVERSASVDTTMVNEDGSRPPELHVKITPEVDDRGHPIFDVTPATGCPHFATGLDPQVRKGLVVVP